MAQVPGLPRSIASLPARFKGAVGSPTHYRLTVGNLAADVLIDRDGCRVEPPLGKHEVEIKTDPATWRAIDAGRMSGIDAFAERKLFVRGGIERALWFEPSFDRPDAGGTRYDMLNVGRGRCRISALVAGDEDAPPLVLVHGLGATKSSWLSIVPRLARHHRVVALDLPGFGASSKPMAPYDAPWFANQVFVAMDKLGIETASIGGNSMGGRIAMEMALRKPDRVEAIACLCPAAAFSKRPWLRLVRFVRPELTFVAPRIPRNQVAGQLRQLFADPDRLHPDWFDAAVDEFRNIWRDPRARIAFARSLRNIYLDEPEGEDGFWARLSGLDVPALYIYGRHDVLITHHFARKVSKHVPDARVKVWSDCGHVPQIEFPERTSAEMLRHFAAASRRTHPERAAVRTG